MLNYCEQASVQRQRLQFHGVCFTMLGELVPHAIIHHT